MKILKAMGNYKHHSLSHSTAYPYMRSVHRRQGGVRIASFLLLLSLFNLTLMYCERALHCINGTTQCRASYLLKLLRCVREVIPRLNFLSRQFLKTYCRVPALLHCFSVTCADMIVYACSRLWIRFWTNIYL